ncbi:MAG: hypothetical protein IKW18_00400 [Clostridia bacterium]|nr:hypothetical protein [Clostridia bacterium]
MIFNTHDRTPSPQSKMLKRAKLYSAVFLGAFFLFLSVAISVSSKNILPGAIVLIAVAIVSAIVMIQMNDMGKAYIKIDGDRITVVDYYLFSKKERYFDFHEVKKAEIVPGNSFHIRGYRYRANYIVFMDADGKYLFKVFNCPETNQYFRQYFPIPKIHYLTR